MSLPEIESVDDLQKMLDDDVPYSYVSYCDGEWYQILGNVVGSQCDGQQYTSKGQELLLECIRENRDMYYMTQFGWPVTQQCFDMFKGMGIGQDIKWFDRNMILTKLWSGDIGPYLASIKKKRTLVVGPPHVANLKIISPVGFVFVPPQNALQDRERVLNETVQAIEELSPEVITFSASFLAKILIHELHKQYGETKWLLDVGSLWDPFCGVLSRGPFKQRKWLVSQKKITDYLQEH